MGRAGRLSRCARYDVIPAGTRGRVVVAPAAIAGAAVNASCEVAMPRTPPTPSIMGPGRAHEHNGVCGDRRRGRGVHGARGAHGRGSTMVPSTARALQATSPRRAWSLAQRRRPRAQNKHARRQRTLEGAFSASKPALMLGNRKWWTCGGPPCKTFTNQRARYMHQGRSRDTVGAIGCAFSGSLLDVHARSVPVRGDTRFSASASSHNVLL